MTHNLKRDTALAMLAAVVAASCMSFSSADPLDRDASRREAMECRELQARIARAEQSYKARSHSRSYTLDVRDLAALDRYPICPDGGRLTVTISRGRPSDRAEDGRIVPDGGLIVRCSHHGHGVFAPGLDSAPESH